VLNVEGKKEQGRQLIKPGWNDSGGKDGEGNARGSVSTPLEVPSDFSAVVASM